MPELTSTCEALILEPLATDMSTVMKVHIQPHDPLPSSPEKAFTAALKLYDRRFGTGLRGRLNLTPPKYGPYPCTSSKEAAYCDFIRNKEVGAFLHDYEEEERANLLPEPACSFLDGSPRGAAKYEAVA